MDNLKDRFCPNCGEELLYKPEKAYLSNKATPNCSIGDVKFVKPIIYIECHMCQFISMYSITENDCERCKGCSGPGGCCCECHKDKKDD